MAEKVEIIVTAKDAASQVLRGVASNFGEIGNAVQQLTSGAGIEYLTAQIVKFGVNSVNSTVAYATEVRKLQQVTGASAEETSRLIQVTDDYGVSVGDLTMAQKKLAGDGITLTTDALANMADEYLRLAPGAERAAFLTEKFGRAGLNMTNLLNQGGQAIRDMSAGIDESLVLTDEAIKNAQDYELAMGDLEAQIQKVQYSIGNELIPVMTDLTKVVNTDIDGIRRIGPILVDAYQDFYKTFDVKKFGEQFREGADLAAEIINNSDVSFLSQGVDSATQSYTAWAQALQGQVIPALEQTEIDTKAIDQANQLLLNTVSTVASAEQSYSQQINQIQSERLALQQQIAATPAWETDKLNDYQVKLGELATKEAETTAAFKQGAAERILSMTEQKLAIGGLTDAEAEYLLEVGKGLGVYTQAQVDAAKTQMAKADELAKGFEQTQNKIVEAEKGKFATSAAAWEEYTGVVASQLDTNIQSVNEYIDSLTDIPTEITTTVNVITQDGADLGIGRNSTTAGGQVVNYYIQNAYIDRNNGIQVV